VTATALPVLVLAVAVVVLVQRDRQASVEAGLQQTARAVALAVDRELDSSVTALRTLAGAPALDDRDFAGFYEHARRAREANPRWLTVYLVERSGRQVMTLLRPLGTVLPDAGAFDYVRAVRDTGRPFVSDLAFGPVSQRHIITVNVPVVRRGRVAFILGASVQTDTFADLLGGQVRAPGSLAAIRDRTDALVARSHDHARHVGSRPAPEVRDRVEAARRQGEGLFEAISLDGVRVQTAVSRVPTADFLVLVAAPAARGDALWWLLAIGAGVILVAALAGAVLVARRIGRSIAALSRSAAELAGGEPISPALPSPVAEVAAVRETIVRAAAALQEREAERARRLAAEAAQAEAEQMSREKDNFLAMLAHELRNPLGAIASAASVLDREGAAGRSAARARDIVARQVGHLSGIVDDLLDVSRVTMGKIGLTRQPVDLAEVVRRSVDDFAADGRSARHHVTLSAAPAWVDGDATRLEQIVGNLLGNALKYTPAGGCIDVRVSTEGPDALVHVRDDGIGIPGDRLPDVFKLFFQGERPLDRSPGGLGIGLTLVKRLTELHGGSVSATSAGQGAGSAFTVRLPRILPPPAVPDPGVTAVRHGRRLRILVVEDHADAREMLRTALELLGHAVIEAGDGEAAIDRAAAGPPDVAIVDLGLPGLDGYEVARRIREQPGGKAILLVALTGYGQAEDRRRSAESGFDLHIVKPVEPEALEQVIAHELDIRFG
jgi:signal transduction histidine kinase/ActR/RegA family two-component response regulator